MNLKIKILIESIVKEVLNENFRDFSLSKFKALDDEIERIAYAEEKLPRLGSGSSRTVYAIGSGKVLKIAGDVTVAGIKASFLSSVMKGEAQNKAEVEIYTDPKLKPVVAPIIDFDHQDYSWVVAEAVKGFRSEKEFEGATELPNYDLWYWLAEAYESADGDIEKAMDVATKALMFNIEQVSVLPDDTEPEKVKEYLKNNILELPITKKIFHLIDLGLTSADLTRAEHWGITSSGKVVVLDYGLTDKVFDEYY